MKFSVYSPHHHHPHPPPLWNGSEQNGGFLLQPAATTMIYSIFACECVCDGSCKISCLTSRSVRSADRLLLMVQRTKRSSEEGGTACISDLLLACFKSLLKTCRFSFTFLHSWDFDIASVLYSNLSYLILFLLILFFVILVFCTAIWFFLAVFKVLYK